MFAAASCKFDPAVLACRGPKSEGCLSTAQVDAVKKVMAGPRASDGRQVYPGYLWDTGITNTRGGLPGVLVGPPIPEGPATGTTMNVDAEAARAHDARSMVGDSNAWTNLSTFQGRGGKLIFFHGVSDAWFSSLDTIQYYGGGERTTDRFNMIEPIVNWVEKGIAPDRIIATGASVPGESRPLCPYPAHASYDGSGDAKDAASYSCR
jgi:feruloyl esterase